MPMARSPAKAATGVPFHGVTGLAARAAEIGCKAGTRLIAGSLSPRPTELVEERTERRMSLFRSICDLRDPAAPTALPR